MATAASALVSSPRLLVFPPSGRTVISKRNSLCPSCGLPGLRCFAARRLGRYASLAISASMLEGKVEKGKTVIPDPDYRIPLVLLGIAGGFLYQDNLLPAATVGLLGLLLLFQTTRVRFVFDEEALLLAGSLASSYPLWPHLFSCEYWKVLTARHALPPSWRGCGFRSVGAGTKQVSALCPTQPHLKKSEEIPSYSMGWRNR